MKIRSILIIGVLFLLTTCEWDLPTIKPKLISQVKNQCEGLPQGSGQICATKQTAIANYVSTPIVIDGFEEAAWVNCQEYIIDKQFVDNILYLPINGPADFSAVFKVLWDNNYLYVLFKIKDDLKFEALNSSIPDLYTYDYAEIFLNPDFSNDTQFDWNNTNYYGDAICIGVDRGINDKARTYHDFNNETQIDNGNQVTWQQQNTTDGWIVECSYKWSYLLPAGFGLHDVMGFDVKVHDKDDDSGKWKVLTWANDTGSDNSYENTGFFGYLLLE